MKGYLQRLVSSVIKPSASIHPMLGSVFAAHRLDRPAEHKELVAQPSSAAETARPAPAAPIRGAEEAGISVPRDVPCLPAPEGRVFQPLVDRRQSEQTKQTERTELPRSPDIQATDYSRIAPSDEPGPILEPSAPVSRQRHIVTADSGQAKEERNAEITVNGVQELTLSEAGNRVYHPLIEENFRRQTPPTVLGETFRDGRKEKRGDSPRREAPVHREPDEIQIHIGRIEVVAAPVSLVRAEPKPVRPSPNLSDYLKRRNGRA